MIVGHQLEPHRRLLVLAVEGLAGKRHREEIREILELDADALAGFDDPLNRCVAAT